MKVPKKDDFWIAGLNRLGAAVAGAGILVMIGLVAYDVIARKLFNSPLIFADEVCGYLMVLVTFLGLSYTMQEGSHIQVKVLVKLTTNRGQAKLRILWCIVGILYTSVLLYWTGKLVGESYELKSFAPTPSHIPLFPFQLIMPIGCFLLLLQLIVELLKVMRVFGLGIEEKKGE